MCFALSLPSLCWAVPQHVQDVLMGIPDSANGICGISELWVSLFLCMCALHFSSHPSLERASCCGVGCEQRPLPVVYSGVVSLEWAKAICGVALGRRWSGIQPRSRAEGSAAVSALVSLYWVSCWWWYCQRGSSLLQKGVSEVTRQQIAEKTFILLHWFVTVARKHLVRISETCEFWLLLS